MPCKSHSAVAFRCGKQRKKKVFYRVARISCIAARSRERNISPRKDLMSQTKRKWCNSRENRLNFSLRDFSIGLYFYVDATVGGMRSERAHRAMCRMRHRGIPHQKNVTGICCGAGTVDSVDSLERGRVGPFRRHIPWGRALSLASVTNAGGHLYGRARPTGSAVYGMTLEREE